MEVVSSKAASPKGLRRWAPWHPDAVCVLVLLLLSGGIHAWLIAHTEVASRDSIGYIRYALQLEEKPWHEALPRQDQHPIYPLTLLAVSVPVRYFLGGTTCDSMVLSAQLASALTGILLVIPSFFLGKDLFDRRTGFWAAALFQSLPVGARVMSDALSEATFFLLVATALWLAVRAVRNPTLLRFALCGLCGGLAYLARPEGALIVAATGLVWLAMQGVRAWKRPWSAWLGLSASLALATLAVAAPYWIVTGRLTVKPTASEMLKASVTQDPEERAGHETAENRKDLAHVTWTRGPVLASIVAVWHSDQQDSKLPLPLWGLWSVVAETVRGFQYIAWLPALLGMWWFRNRLRDDPAAWVPLVVAVLHVLILWRMAVVAGYVSERHTLLLVFCGCFWAAAGVLAIGEAMATAGRKAWSAFTTRLPAAWPGVALLAAFVATMLPATLKPLHANRAGHRAAGEWLAAHTHPADIIVDPFCWGHFYAGRVFLEGRPCPPVPPGYETAHYVILTLSENAHARLPNIPLAHRIAAQGQIVFRWTPGHRKDRAEEVVIYHVPDYQP